MDSSASGLFVLTERLGRARERSRLLIVMQGAIYGLSAVLGAYALAELARKLVPAFGEASAPDVPFAIGAAALAVAVASTAILAFIRIPSLIDLARRADTRFGLDERLSTALEIEGRGRASTVSAALLRDAGRRAGLVDSAALVPMHLPRASWLLPLALAAALAAFAVPEAQTGAAINAEARPAALSEGERRELAEDIARVAEIVQQQAETRQDTYLGAVARTLGNLAERTDSGEITTRAELAAELATLETHAHSAVARARDPNALRIPALLEALQDRVQPVSEAPEPQLAEAAVDRDLPGNSPLSTPTPAGEAGEQAQPTAGDSPAAAPERPGGESADLDQLLDEASSGSRPPEMKPTRQPGDGPKNYYEIARQQAAETARLQAQMPPSANAELLGGAEESGQGESSLAGKGTDDLRGEGDLPPLDFETGSDMRLEATDSNEGRRIQIKTTPEAHLSDVAAGEIALDGAAWRALPEAAVARNARGAASRAIVAKYLSAMSEQTE